MADTKNIAQTVGSQHTAVILIITWHSMSPSSGLNFQATAVDGGGSAAMY
jgi:hypothetical protein